MLGYLAVPESKSCCPALLYALKPVPIAFFQALFDIFYGCYHNRPGFSLALLL